MLKSEGGWACVVTRRRRLADLTCGGIFFRVLVWRDESEALLLVILLTRIVQTVYTTSKLSLIHEQTHLPLDRFLATL